MFVGTGTPRKPQQREAARQLRREQGMPIKRIAKELGVSPSSVHHWTRDIVLTPEQRKRNLSGPEGPVSPRLVAQRAAAWSRRSRIQRFVKQYEGRERVRASDDPLHMAGCMLYWAEGAKSRNQVKFANSDPNMMRFFVRFLRSCFGLSPEEMTMRLNVYTGNRLSLEEIENHWLEILELPRTTLRKHTVNHMPTSSSGRKRNKLPYGVCSICVSRTDIVQHIYGAIQEYGGFEEPRWLE